MALGYYRFTGFVNKIILPFPVKYFLTLFTETGKFVLNEVMECFTT